MGLALSGPSLPVWVAFLFLESESILTDIGHLISYYIQLCILILFLNDFIYLFLDTGREGERQEEKHQCVVASLVPPTWDLDCNPGMCPDRESNWQPFDLQASTQSTESHKPGLYPDYL